MLNSSRVVKNMENELIESKATMSFHLDGESEIDATLLAHMISDMADFTKLMAKEVNPDAYLKMNVTAFRNGSFQVDYSAVCQAAESMFTAIGVVAATAGTVIAAVKGGIEIKKLLKGERPKEVKKLPDGFVEVESEDGNKVITPAASQSVIYNIRADQLISNISNYVQEHDPRGGFTLSDGGHPVYCSAEDVKGMSRLAPIVDTVTCQRSRIEVDMLIRKPVLEGNSKWGFDYNGRAIDAAIEDGDFLEWFQEHGTVNRGDHIHATLEILVDIDPNGSPIKGTEKYCVVKVHGKILHSSEQKAI